MGGKATEHPLRLLIRRGAAMYVAHSGVQKIRTSPDRVDTGRAYFEVGGWPVPETVIAAVFKLPDQFVDSSRHPERLPDPNGDRQFRAILDCPRTPG